MKTYISTFIFLLMYGCASSEDHNQKNISRSVDSQNSVTVREYCESFAIKYAENRVFDYQKNSVKIEKTSDISMWLSNFFHPSGSTFTAGYDCVFQIRDKKETIYDISVLITLSETMHFAEHTQWKKLQIVPIEYVWDEAHDRAGYGVFKYLKSPLE